MYYHKNRSVSSSWMWSCPQWEAVWNRLCLLLELHKRQTLNWLCLERALWERLQKAWHDKPILHCDLWIVTSYCSQFFTNTSDATQTSNSASSIHNWTKLWIKSIGAIHLGLVASLYPQNKQNKRFIAQRRWRGPDVNLAVAQQLSSSCTPPSPEIKYSNTLWSKWN